jgi:hypothetical protein
MPRSVIGRSYAENVPLEAHQQAHIDRADVVPAHDKRQALLRHGTETT